MRDLFINAMLVLAILAVLGFVGWVIYAETNATAECQGRGFAKGSAMINGDIVCYRGEVIRSRR